MIKGPSGKDATSHSLAQASVLGGSSSSPKRSKKFSKIMAAKEDPNDKWKTTIKKLVSNAEQEQDEESAKRLALIKDSRRAKASMSISGDHAKSDTFGQQKSKKTNKWQDALPLVPKKSKKEIVGGKDYEDADLAFYKAFKYIFVDIPEAEEDFPSESSLIQITNDQSLSPLSMCDIIKTTSATNLSNSITICISYISQIISNQNHSWGQVTDKAGTIFLCGMFARLELFLVS